MSCRSQEWPPTSTKLNSRSGVLSDEARGRVQLSLLPLEQLAQKEARQKEQRNRSFKKPGNKNKNNNKNNVKSEKPKKESVSMEEATRRLMERFGK